MIVAVATNIVQLGVIFVQRFTIRDNRIALNQWKQYGVSVKKKIGWSDSNMVTGLRIHDTKTKTWARASHYPIPAKESK